MKKYILTAVIDGRTKSFQHQFNSRNEALNYIFHYYVRHNYESLQVNEEFFVNDNKHNIEYVCDYTNRFRINRIIA